MALGAITHVIEISYVGGLTEFLYKNRGGYDFCPAKKISLVVLFMGSKPHLNCHAS